MNTKNLTVILALIILVFQHLIGQEFDWIHSTGYYGFSRSMAYDSNGSLYVAGEFIGDADFGNYSLNSSSNTNPDIFFVKYDTAGNCLWAKSIGDSLYETCFEVAVDNNQDVYITGMYDGTVLFGDFELTTQGYYDIYLAKYNPDGECLWLISAGGEYFFDHALTMDFDSENNVFLTGCFDHTAMFGDTIVSAGVASGGNPNTEWGGETFLAKYSSDGDFLWVKYIPGTHHINRGHSLIIDSQDNIYMSGKFQGEMYFDDETIISNGHFDIFTARFNNDGNVIWVNNSGGNLDDKPTPSAVAIDGSNNVYLSGYFKEESDFNGNTLFSNGMMDIYLVKYDQDGNVVWVKNEGGTDDERVYGISQYNHRIYLTGYFNGSSVFDNSIVLTSQGAKDIFVGCYNTDGNFLWADRHGGQGDDWAFQIVNDESDGYYITGFHNNQASFGDTTIYTSGFANLFFGKFTDNTVYTGLQTKAEKNSILYPNPSNGSISLCKDILQNKNSLLRIYDQYGNTVFSKSGEIPGKLNCQFLPNGIYCIYYSSPEEIITSKIIIRK